MRLMGNSAEKIAALEEDCDFSEVSMSQQEEAKKGFNAVKSSASRRYGGKVLAAYTLLVKWNVESSHTYKGYLIRQLAGEGEDAELSDHGTAAVVATANRGLLQTLESPSGFSQACGADNLLPRSSSSLASANYHDSSAS